MACMGGNGVMDRWNLVPTGGPSGERGFTLLEGMLASVFLAVGVLTLTAMQGIALVKNIDAKELTRVTTLASDMMERIQFNRRNVATYNGIDTASAANCSAINATSQPQAKGDCLLWASLVAAAQLNDARGTVGVSNVINPVVLGQRNVVVTLTWSDPSVQRTRSVTLNRTVSAE